MTYNTEANRKKGIKYRAKHRDQVLDYQRKYQKEHYDTPTIRLTQVRANIKRCEEGLIKWRAEEQELLKLQSKHKEPTLGDWLNAQTIQISDND